VGRSMFAFSAGEMEEGRINKEENPCGSLQCRHLLCCKGKTKSPLLGLKGSL
jgi:hypothetical protein